MTNEQLLQVLVWLVLALGGGLVGMIVWAARSINEKVDGLAKLVRRELTMFDRRLVRVEAKLDLPIPVENHLDDDPE